MCYNPPRSRIGSVAAVAIALVIGTAPATIAQQNAIRMEDPANGQGIVWWVVGAGGVLGAGSDQGEHVSATVGQAAIDRASDDGFTAFYGYWLPSIEAPSAIEIANDGNAYHDPLAARVAPNPFRVATRIAYRLPSISRVIVRIFDLVGIEVRMRAEEMQSEAL